LRDFIPDSNSDGTIPCIVIPTKTASVFRQAKENTSRSGLTAIGMARQAALLLLSVHGHEIPNYPVDNDFYRQALELDLRGKHEFTDTILAAMGGISKFHFSHFKSLLNLSDEALEVADRHDLDEGQLRYVVKLPREHHAEMITQIVQFNLTVKQVREMCDTSSDRPQVEPQVSRAAKQLLKFLKAAEEVTPQEFVTAMLSAEHDKNVVRARLQSLYQYLIEIDQALASTEKG